MKITGTFTKEAEQLIDAEIKEISTELRSAAMDEALRSRGEPVEITASDVRRARKRLVWRRTPLRPMTELTLKLYMVIGALLFLGGLLYPYATTFIKQAARGEMVSFLMALMGLCIGLAAVFAKYYLEIVHRIRMKKRFEDIKTDRERVGSQNEG